MDSGNDLLKVIANLESTVKTLRIENKSLTLRVNYLEDLVKKLCEKESIPVNFSSLPPILSPKRSINMRLNKSLNVQMQNISNNSNSKNLPSISQSAYLGQAKDNTINKETNITNNSSSIINNNYKIKPPKDQKEMLTTEKEETWLYFIINTSPKIKTEKILNALNINDPDKTVIEISANDYCNESEFYVRLLEKFETFNEFNQDFQSMELQQVISYFEEIFEVSLMSDTVVIIRDVPSKKNSSYEGNMVIIASFIERIIKIFNNVIQKESEDNEGYGKMNLILETKEEMNIVNVVKNENRFILNIEKLNV